MKEGVDKKQILEYNNTPIEETPPDFISENGGKFWFGNGCPNITSCVFFENKEEDKEKNKEIKNGEYTS